MSGLVLRPALLAAGVDDGELRRLRAARTLAVVRPGAFVRADDPRLGDPDERHWLAVHAALARLAPDAVVSHVSAAVLHGLPIWDVDRSRVHVTRTRRAGGRRGAWTRLHAAPLEPDEVVVLDGVAVTSVARTVTDLARTVGYEQAVVIADAALAAGLVSPAQLVRAAERSAHRAGSPRARRVAAFADGRSESPGESRSRVALAWAGLPAPQLQHVVRAADGRPLGRVDFWWEHARVAGEFDGRAKYGRLLPAGRSAGDAVVDEKRREDLIRDEDVRFVRWMWPDLDRFDAVAARLWRALGGR